MTFVFLFFYSFSFGHQVKAAPANSACQITCHNLAPPGDKKTQLIPTQCSNKLNSQDCIAPCNAYCTSLGGQYHCEDEKCVAGSSGAVAPNIPVGRYGLIDPLGGANIPTIVSRVVRYLLGFVGALFLLFFIYGGILWMTAGSSDRVKKAKKTLVYAVLGMVIVILSYTIITAVINLSGAIITGG